MRVKEALTAVALAVAGTGFAVTAGAGPALAASCPDNGWSTKDGTRGQLFDGSNVNIRVGPDNNRCKSVGFGQYNHDVRYDCYKEAVGGTWTHLYDYTTSRGGWVRDDLLDNYGSSAHC